MSERGGPMRPRRRVEDAELAAVPLVVPLEMWVQQRVENCRRIGATKVGMERAGWVEDAAYFDAIRRRLMS